MTLFLAEGVCVQQDIEPCGHQGVGDFSSPVVMALDPELAQPASRKSHTAQADGN